MSKPILRDLLPLFAALFFLTSCGGGGGDGGSSGNLTAASAEVNVQTANEGLDQFNLRRQQLGLQAVVLNDALTAAAQGHSNYQTINREITHDQTRGNPGFTGVEVGDRLLAAGYPLPSNDYAFGEVISKTSDPSGTRAAEDLIAAIYHRFVIFEPMFKEVGVGAASESGGPTYFTTNFAVIGLTGGLTEDEPIVTYPVQNQVGVPRVFYSDNEIPDPVPGANAVGYPISVHTNINSELTVSSFTLEEAGSPLPVRLLSAVTDPTHIPNPSVAAIVPYEVLKPVTTYTVKFTGSVDLIKGDSDPPVPVNESWTFTTK